MYYILYGPWIRAIPIYRLLTTDSMINVRVCVRASRKMFALPGNGLNLEAFSFTKRVVGYQQGVAIAIYLTTGT